MSSRAFVISVTVLLLGLIAALGVSIASGRLPPQLVQLGLGAVLVMAVVLYEVWRASR